MKIPVEWLKQYIKTNKTTKELAQSFTSLGLMLDKPVMEYKDGNYETDVLDLEHRMDRSDWLSITGCARDLAAFEKAEFITPELYTQQGQTPEPNQVVDIQVKCPDMVNRFNTRVFRNIRVGESPAWLKDRLQAYGIPSINNIVDITNYVMVETGQPMHAQDLAKMEKQEIVIRKAKNGEQITTLLGETVTLDEGCFVLTQNDKPTVLGGIVGGQATGIDSNTKDIILDAGNYNQVVIRKASRKLKIQNETVLRYDKFLHPDLTEVAIFRATKLILDLAGGIYYSNIDWYPTPAAHKKFTLRLERIKTLSGMAFSKESVRDILVRLGYLILNDTDQIFEVQIPIYRTDIEVEDDIVADILRINNYSNIPSALLDKTPPVEITPAIYNFEEKVRQIMVKIGGHEHITEPLVGAEANNTNQIILENSQSEEKNALRTNIYQTLEKVTQVYEKNKIHEFVLFEIGKTYFKKDLTEQRELEIITHCDSLLETSQKTKVVLRDLLKELGINNYQAIKNGDVYNIQVDKVIIGELTYNSARLFLKELLSKTTKDTRATTQNPYMLFEDISVVIPLKEEIGPIYDLVASYDPAIEQVQIKAEKLDNDKKNVVIRIFHNTQNFAEIKQSLIGLLKALPNLEMRS